MMTTLERTARDHREADDAGLRDLRDRVAASVHRTCPAWLAEQADDIVQNVMTQLVRSGMTGEANPAPSTTYLRKAAYGATVDEIRRRCRMRERTAAEGHDLDLSPSGAAGPDRWAAAAEIGRGIRACLARLVRPRRLAVTVFLQGCTVPETAAQFGWTTKKANNLVYRGLADLRQCLERKGLKP